MNIESSNIKQATQTKSQSQNATKNNSSVKFADELKELEKVEKTNFTQTTNKEESKEVKNSKEQNQVITKSNSETISENKLDKSRNELENVMKQFTQSEEKESILLKSNIDKYDNIKNDSEKDESLINNDFNINDKKDSLPQMNPNMNFSGDGQSFSSFMGNENQGNNQKTLVSSAKELAEEAAILSTAEENIAIANKNLIVTPVENTVVENKKVAPVENVIIEDKKVTSMENTIIEDLNVIETPAEKTVTREDGIKKIDVKSGITIETVVKYDSVVMNQADVEVFATLVDKGEVNLNNLAPEAAEKSVQVSKTLADMLAKSKETQQPLRIDFDNGISVIIKISRDGKVSADFLPSTQIAETYLKENLPLLKQRFDEKNLDYNELNRREKREQNREQNQKKGRRDE